MTTKYSDDLALIINAPHTAYPPSRRIGGRVRVATDAFEVATTDLDVGDIIVLARLPSYANITELKIASDDLGTTLTVDIGIYEINGAVADADVFSTGVDLAAAATNLTDYRYEVANRDTAGKALWEMLALTVDPNKAYDIALTVATSGTPAAGTIAYEIRYAVD